MNNTKACIFDAYGTLFDVNAACRELSLDVGDKWEDLASLWRLRQVEYTWLRNSMNEYVDFWEITANALDYAMEVLNLKNKNIEAVTSRKWVSCQWKQLRFLRKNCKPKRRGCDIPAAY